MALSCASKEAKFDSQFNQLQTHMTFDQVKQLLGPPDLREVKPKTPETSISAGVLIETWHYIREDGRVVLFEGGQVTSFGRDNGVSSTVDRGDGAKVIVTPRAIGETCRVDSECIEQNCHFHICSGKNNCQVPVGAVCATNQDCCGGFCDFNICKKR